MPAARDVAAMIFPRACRIPEIAQAEIAEKRPAIEPAGECHPGEDSQIMPGQFFDDRGTLGPQNIVVDHHRFECRQRHDTFNHGHVEAVDAEMADFALLLDAQQRVEQLVGQVFDLRTVELKERYRIELQVPQAVVDTAPYRAGRPILVEPARGAEPGSSFGGDDEIVFVFQPRNRAAEPRLRIAAAVARSGIEEGHAPIGGRMHQANGIRLAENSLAPEARAAKPDFRNAQIGAPETAIEHRINLKCWARADYRRTALSHASPAQLGGPELCYRLP